eukprot:767153-Hanusia_phi.AAC.2
MAFSLEAATKEKPDTTVPIPGGRSWGRETPAAGRETPAAGRETPAAGSLAWIRQSRLEWHRSSSSLDGSVRYDCRSRRTVLSGSVRYDCRSRRTVLSGSVRYDCRSRRTVLSG